jgi:NAD+ diphosphatase
MLSERVAFTPGISSTAAEGRLYLVSGQSLCVAYAAGGGEPRVPIGPVPRQALYLGELDGTPCFTRLLGDGEAAPDGTDPIALRQLFGALPDEDFGVAGRALGITAWDRDHRYCGRCAAPTERSQTERVRTCSRCGFASYPRLSPAIIALIERDGRALLARNARFPLPFFSTLAGFVEVGESLEHAVAREIREEAGIEIADIRYFGSQPWPFTGSLMIGFTARWSAGEIVGDPTEIADADWFGPDELPRIPPKLSIARELIDDFVVRHGGTPRD